MFKYSLPEAVKAGILLAPPAPGYHVVEEQVYRRWAASNNSCLKELAGDRTPLDFLNAMLYPSDSSDDKAFGSACHCVLLRPDSFKKEYRQGGDCMETLKSGENKGQRCKNPATYSFNGHLVCGSHSKGLDKATADNINIVTPTEWKALIAIQNNVYQHTDAAWLLSQRGHRERAMVWEDHETGRACKALNDLDIADLAVDLKSTESVARPDFVRSIIKWGYHTQAAMTMMGHERLGFPKKAFTIIAFEKVPPYHVRAFEVDEPTVRYGVKLVNERMRLVSDCVERGEWDGYSGKTESIGVPPIMYMDRHEAY